MCWFMRKFPLTDDDLSPMVRGHQITLDLARSAGLVQLLNDLHNPDLRRQMREQPKDFLLKRSINIPQGASVEVRELQANGWEVEIRVVEGLYAYINGFKNEKGFYRIPGPQVIGPSRYSSSLPSRFRSGGAAACHGLELLDLFGFRSKRINHR